MKKPKPKPQPVSKRPEKIMPWDYKRNKDANLPPVKPPAIKYAMEHDVIMSLPEAMVEAASLSRNEKRYVYINLDNSGDASLARKFEKNSSVFCYYNGGQVSMDDETSMPLKENSQNNLTNNQMSKSKKEAVKPAKSNKNLVTVPGLTYKGKPVSIPAARAKKWVALLNKLYGK